MMFPYIRTANQNTLQRISSTDYGMDAKQHLQALQQVMTVQNGYLSADLGQYYYPAETVELMAYHSEDAHAYTICHLMIIQSVLAETYGCLLSFYWNHYQKNRDGLPPSMQQELDAAYRLADEKGMIDHDWV